MRTDPQPQITADPRSAHRVATTALLAGAAYLIWRVTSTISEAPLIVSLALVLAEVFGFLRLAQFVHDAWQPALPPLAGGGLPVGPMDDVTVVVIVADQDAEQLERTLVACEPLAGAGEVIVVADPERSDLNELLVDFGVRHVSSNQQHLLGRFIEGAANAETGWLLWLDAGDVPLPQLIEVGARRVVDHDVAVVQVAQDLMNHDSMTHLRSGGSGESLNSHVIGPGRGARGRAPWWGSGSLVRRSALEHLRGLEVNRAGSLQRAVVCFDSAGMTTRFESTPLVRSSAPDTLRDYLNGRRCRSIERLGVLSGPSGLFDRSRVPLRVRLRHASLLIPALAPIQYLTLLSVLLVTLVSGRLPLDASPAELAVTWLPVALLSALTRRALARGTMSWGDWTRQTWRTFGADLAALGSVFVGRDAVRDKAGRTTGMAALGHMRALSLAVIALDLALLARGGTLVAPDLLPRFEANGPLVLAIAFVTLIPMVDVLQLVARRTQRRGQYRLAVDHVAHLGGREVQTLDLTTRGIGVLADTKVPIGEFVELELQLPDGAGSTRVAQLRAVVASTTDHPGATVRLGLKYVDLEPATRRQLITYCMLTHHLLERGDVPLPENAGVLIDSLSTEAGRPWLKKLTVAAALVCGVTGTFGPSAAAAVNTPLAVCLATSSGDPVAGAEVTYSAGSWTSFGSTAADGCISGNVPEGSIRLRITSDNLTAETTHDATVDPVFTFVTSPVTVRFELSDGTPVVGVPVVYAGSRWAEFGVTGADGSVSREFLGSSRLRVRATHENLSEEIVQDTGTDPVFTFVTSPVTVRFELSDGTPVVGVPVVYAGSRWAEFGVTGADGSVSREFLGSSRLRVRATHENLSEEIVQDTGTDPVFTFVTSPVTVRFELSDGTPVVGVPVVYAGSRWAEFGVTGADGSVSREFLGSSRLRVRATHENLSEEIVQDTGTDPVFTFVTSPVTVRFELSDGTPVVGVPVVYAGSRWAEFGVTGADGSVSREFLGSSRLRVRATHENLSEEIVQDTGTDPVFTFTTGRLVQGDGERVASYRGSAWTSFTSGIELLPGSLMLRLDSGATPTVDVLAGQTIVVPSGALVTTTTTAPTTTTTTSVPATTTTASTTSVPATTTTASTTSVPATTTTTTSVPATTASTTEPTTATTAPTTSVPATTTAPTTTTRVPTTTTTTTSAPPTTSTIAPSTTTTSAPTTTTSTTAAPTPTEAAPTTAPRASTGANTVGPASSLPAMLLRIEQQFADSMITGGVTTNTITVTNIGQASTNGTITITGELPAGLAFVASTGSHGTRCDSLGGLVTCTTNASIAASSSFVVEFDLRVLAEPGTNLVSRVDVGGEQLAGPVVSADQDGPQASSDLSSTVSMTVADADDPAGSFNPLWLLLVVLSLVLLALAVLRVSRRSGET